MVFCDEKGLGGEDEVELLMEPLWNGLLDRFEGLVLLGLGPPAMLSFVEGGAGTPCWRQRRVGASENEASETSEGDSQRAGARCVEAGTW